MNDNKKEDKFKTVYQISFEKYNPLVDQIKWVDNQLSNLSSNEDRKLFKPTIQGEIRRYTRKDGKKGLFLVLEKTNYAQPMVLICPIYLIRNKDELISGYRIGMIPAITTDYEFVAAINEIRFVHKSKVEINESSSKPICYLLKKQLIDIFYIYKSLIESVMSFPGELKKIYTA